MGGLGPILYEVAQLDSTYEPPNHIHAIVLNHEWNTRPLKVNPSTVTKTQLPVHWMFNLNGQVAILLRTTPKTKRINPVPWNALR